MHKQKCQECEKLLQECKCDTGKEYYNGKAVWEIIEHCDLNFNRGNIVKYVCRAGKKDKKSELDDLKKARDYLNREIERNE